MYTIKDVAQKAGVAKSTVSNVLSGKKYVGEDLKEKVLKACVDLSFHPDFFASTLINKKTNIIGLFLEQNCEVSYPMFYNTLISSILIQASKKEYNLLVYYNVVTDKLISLLQHGKSPIDGAIILSPEILDKRLSAIKANRIPCVIIGRPDNTIDNVNTVDTDNTNIVEKIVTRLIEKGRKRILFLNSKIDYTVSVDRVKGFCNAYKRYSLDIDNNLIFHIDRNIEEEGFKVVERAITDKVKFDAIITSNDLMAKGCYDALIKAKISIGKDVSVVALGGEKYIKELIPTLSYAHQNYVLIGDKCVEILLENIENSVTKSQHFVVNSQIFYGESF